MSPDTIGRRKSGKLAAIVDEAIVLAHGCGWRYALTYLVSEHISPEIIQRLMFAGAGHRRRPMLHPEPPHTRLSSAWRDDEKMRELFVSLHRRKSGNDQ